LTLTTHAIVGAAIVSIFPDYPLLALPLAFVSHFLLDSLPHWDYPLHSSSIDPRLGAPMKYDWKLCADLLTIGGDAVLGIVLASLIFAAHNPAHFFLILGGACAAMLPDPLQFAYVRFPHQPLTSLQRFHHWVHTSYRMRGRPVLGVASQLCLIVSVVIIVHPLLPL
jgi:hypothetical protein